MLTPLAAPSSPVYTWAPEAVVHDALERFGSRIRGRYADCSVCGRRRKLGVLEMRDGSIWLHCFKGCESKDVIAVLGLEWQDLFEHRFTPERIQGRDVDRERARRDDAITVAVYEAIESFKFSALSRAFRART